MMIRTVWKKGFWTLQAERFRDLGMTAKVQGSDPQKMSLKVHVPNDDGKLQEFLSKANGLRHLGLVAVEDPKAQGGPNRIYVIKPAAA
jgi:hypothetical protein